MKFDVYKADQQMLGDYGVVNRGSGFGKGGLTGSSTFRYWVAKSSQDFTEGLFCLMEARGLTSSPA